MKKKFFVLALLLAATAVMTIGCNADTLSLVKDNLSEVTNVFYFGENEDFYCSLSSGQREEEYLLNGKSENLVDFAILSVVLPQNAAEKTISVELNVDGTVTNRSLEINSLESAYMDDLEKKFSGNEHISISYGGQTLTLQNLSKDFGVDAEKALEIGARELEDKILLKKTFSNLNAEIYLRVMDKKANNFDDFFWCFSVLNVDSENYSVIISTLDGSILAKSK